MDQLAAVGIDLQGKAILDVSGGPGYVACALQELGAKVLVTEYAPSTVKKMKGELKLDAVVFDYTSDDLSKITEKTFDLIMVRSSIIFCENLESFVAQVKSKLNPGGMVFLESILPTYGEIFWWQQLEYKFPRIYSQETIEKTFRRNGFFLKCGYKDCGGYLGVKWRSYASFDRHFFTWALEFPMVAFYCLLNVFKKAPIDASFNHKMITQFWTMTPGGDAKYAEYAQGSVNKSKTFGYRYNGYLRRQRG
jgi:hypothetical protein